MKDREEADVHFSKESHEKANIKEKENSTEYSQTKNHY